MDHERTKPKLAARLLTRQERQSAVFRHEINCIDRLIARSDRKEEIMATAKQLALIQELDIEKRSCASRQFANAQRQNIVGQSGDAALVLAAKSGDGRAFEILIERYQRRILAVARRFSRVREDAEELSTEEAARVMRLSVGGVKSRVFHGRRRLRRLLKRESTRMSEKPSLRASRKASGLSRHQLVCSFGD